MGRESREWIRGVGCCLAIVAVGLAGQAARAAGTRRPRRIAIVPLQNLRPNTDTDWIGVGAAETLTTKLGELPDLITVERTRISKIIEERRLQAALSDVGTAVKVGKLVGAERMLIGSYAKTGANIQFNVRVVDVATSVVLNRASVVRPEAKMFDALYALAEAVIESFKKKGVVVDNRPAVVAAQRAEHIILTQEEAAKFKSAGTTNVAAFKVICQGFAASDPDERIRLFTRVMELDPKYAAAYCNRGNAYRKQGHHDRAIRDFDRAIELDPKYARAYHCRGFAYLSNRDSDLAVRDFDKAIELDPKFAMVYSARGLAYEFKRDYDRAFRDYDRAIELAPRDARAYCYRSSAYARRRDYDRAIRDLDKAIELDPKYVWAYQCRGFAYYYKRNYTKAWADVKACQRLGGKVKAKFLVLLRKASGRDK